MTHLTVAIDRQIATLVVNNPPQNRLGPELASALDAVDRSDARAVLLRAEGPDFSFGGDIVPWPKMTTRELRTLFERYLEVFNRFERIPLPTIAAVQGLCFGGGLELAVAALIAAAAS